MKKFILLLALSLGLQYSIFGQDVPEKQQVVITKIGATWCPNCGTQAWDNFDEINQNFRADAVILSVHPSGSSKLHSAESAEFVNNLPQAWGQPLFYVNREKYSTNEIISNASTAISNADTQNPIANTGIEAVAKGDNLEIKAKVKFFQEGEGDYYLSLLVVEDGVVEKQSNRGDNAVHKKILRSSLSGGTFGQNFTSGNVLRGAEFEFNDTKIIDGKWSTENLEVTAILWKKVNDAYEFVNANSEAVLRSTSLNFLEQQGVSLAVTPSLFQENATIFVESPIQLNKVDLSIFNIAGQEVLNVYEGPINIGKQSFDLQKNASLTSGIYFLKMQANDSVIHQKFVVE